MSTVYRLDNGDGTYSPWQFFSQSQGRILEFQDEEEAKAACAAEGPAPSIADVLGGTEDENSNDGQDDDASGTPTTSTRPVPTVAESSGGTQAPRKRGRPRKTPEPVDPAKALLSAAFVKRLKEKLATGTATISVELERFLVSRFGFSTEEVEDDDPDFELIQMGWAAMWESFLQGKEPPWWLLVAFGHICLSVRLIAMAKRKPPQLASVPPETKAEPNGSTD